MPTEMASLPTLCRNFPLACLIFPFDCLIVPVRDKEVPVQFHREFRQNPLRHRLFRRLQTIYKPSESQNSRLFSLIDANLGAETGSIWTASSASQSSLCGVISGCVSSADI